MEIEHGKLRPTGVFNEYYIPMIKNAIKYFFFLAK